MRPDQKHEVDLGRLPAAFVDRLTRPLARFLQIEAASGALLLLCAVAALILSNGPWSSHFVSFWEIRVGFQSGSFEFGRSLRDWINDGLMTLFFFLVALELKRELVLGELKNPRIAALSVAAALGGMLVPAALYLALQSGRAGEAGWGTVMATDTAFVIGCLALLRTRIPQSLRIFMLSLAIVDDIGAILVVAIGYSNSIVWGAVALGMLGLFLVRAMALLGVRSVPIYFLIGALIWIAVDASGVHPTIAGVMLGLLTPATRWVSDERLYAILDRVIAYPVDKQGSGDTKDRGTLQLAEIAARETLSPVERLEIVLHSWVGFAIMPVFALANAGVSMASVDLGNPITTAVFAGFLVGKPIGVLGFTWLAALWGIAVRPPDLSWALLAAGALLAGIGFTMALFIATLAFSEENIAAAKLGILSASVVAATAGVGSLAWLSSRSDKRSGRRLWSRAIH